MDLISLCDWMSEPDPDDPVITSVSDYRQDAVIMRVAQYENRNEDRNENREDTLENSGASVRHAIGPPFAFICWRTLPGGRTVTSYDLKSRQAIAWGTSEITRMHRHEFLELAYVVKGEFSQLIGDRRQIFPEGSVCLIDRNSVHADFVRDQDHFVVFLCMKDEFLDEAFLAEVTDDGLLSFLRMALLRQRKSRQFLRCMPRSAQDAVGPMIARVLEEKTEGLKGSGFIIKGLMVRILNSLATDFIVDMTNNRASKRSDLLFYEMDAYLRSNLAACSLPGLAARFHFQESYVSRLIKEHAGISFSRYLQELRIEKARELLRTTRLSAHEVIQSVGYENRTHFYRLFRQVTGMTPEQYRQKS